MNDIKIFKFSNAELCQRSDKLSLSFNRDQDEFLNYGYDASTIETLQTRTEVLKQFPSDAFYEGNQKLATDAKNNSRTTLEANIIDLRNRVKFVYGTKSVDYGIFQFGKIGDSTDSELVQIALHVCQVAEPRLDKLAERKVTAETIDEIKANRTELDDLIDAQAIAITERKEKTLERIKLANELYKQISELSDVGKLVWKGKNEAFYNDYVIYGSTKSMIEESEIVETE